MADSKEVEVFDKLRGILNKEVMREVSKHSFKRRIHPLFFNNSCVLILSLLYGFDRFSGRLVQKCVT